MKRIVVALGGNALGNNPEEQKAKVLHAVEPIAALIRQGHQVIIAHGNGPQVGMINLAFETAAKNDSALPQMPFPECGAMSQGYIGYHLQNALQTELKRQNMDVHVATIITQVEVAKDDQAFQHPSKPIGAFYSKDEATRIAEKTGYIMKEDANRGYRRVVPSPKPIDIVEIDIIKTLVENNHVVITVGGGGIPVIKNGNRFEGVPAVIDKDFASAKLAELLDADMLIILTAVDRIKIDFNKPEERSIDTIKADELTRYIAEGHFHKGSMLPKVEAALAFVNHSDHRVAIIAALEDAALAVEGKAGTMIKR
ncbi:MAG: carbamate kinase [Bacilli bacterium]|nr:carbamate kinase [Bacilli bacterium]